MQISPGEISAGCAIFTAIGVVVHRKLGAIETNFDAKIKAITGASEDGDCELTKRITAIERDYTTRADRAEILRMIESFSGKIDQVLSRLGKLGERIAKVEGGQGG